MERTFGRAASGTGAQPGESAAPSKDEREGFGGRAARPCLALRTRRRRARCAAVSRFHRSRPRVGGADLDHRPCRLVAQGGPQCSRRGLPGDPSRRSDASVHGPHINVSYCCDRCRQHRVTLLEQQPETEGRSHGQELSAQRLSASLNSSETACHIFGKLRGVLNAFRRH